ncbi:MAG: SpoIIE family protein phosphatase [Bacillota bacterium]
MLDHRHRYTGGGSDAAADGWRSTCDRVSTPLAALAVREFIMYAAVFMMGVFIGRAQIMNLLAPFSIPYVLASLCWSRRMTPFALIGVALGRGWLVGYGAAVSEALMLAAFWLSAEMMCGSWREESAPRGVVGVGVGACVIFRGAAHLWTGATLYRLCLLLFEMIMVACSSLVFHRALPQVLSPEERPEGADFGSNLAAGIFGGVLLLGTAGLRIGDLRVIWVVATLLVMSFAGRGVTGGIAAGAAVGLIVGFSLHFDLPLALALACAGAAAGCMARWGRAGVAAGFISGMLAVSWLSSAGAVPSPWEFLAAVGLYLLSPLGLDYGARREVAAAAAGRPWFAAEESSARLFRRVQKRRRPREAVASLFRRIRSPGGPRDEGEVPERMRSFARVFRRLADSFSEVSTAEQCSFTDQEREAEILDRVGQQVCRKCDRYSECWQDQFMTTYRILSEVLATFEIDDQRSIDARIRKLQQHCRGMSDSVLEAMRSSWTLQRMGMNWSSQFAETRDLAAAQFRGIADMMEDFARGAASGSRPQRSRKQCRLRYDAGVAAIARGGHRASGDSHLVRKLRARDLVVLLSDGMGAGDRARQESRAAVSLLEELLELGLDRDAALRTVNSVLVLRSTEEIFATVDMLSVDLVTGRAEFTKIGAAPTFITRGREVFCIPSQVIPIGILNEVAPESTSRVIQPGDTVVMMTDGVMEALGDLTESQKRNWIARFLQSGRWDCSEDLASALVAQAASLSVHGPVDDMSVVAVEFLER